MAEGTVVVVEVTETSSRIMDPELIAKRIKAQKLEKQTDKDGFERLEEALEGVTVSAL